MDRSFATLETEFQSDLIVEIRELPLPRIEDETLGGKLETVRQLLRRSIELRDRVPALVNAFHLGKLLNQTRNATTKSKLKKNLTSHYATVAEYTYDIFELNPCQILHTSSISVQTIRRLKRRQVLRLRNIIENNVIYNNFAGAQNLGEAIVTGDPAAE